MEKLQTISTSFEKLKSLISRKDKEFFEKAHLFAAKAHEGQKRITGEPYIIHPLEVAFLVHKKFGDIEMTAAALLHDVVEDCNVEVEKIYTNFGNTVGFLVDGLTKTRKNFYQKKKPVFEDKIERLLWAGIQDVRVLLVKIADRTNNIETLEKLKDSKQVRMAFETQAIYQPMIKILHWQLNISLQDTTNTFHKYLSAKHISDEKQFKELLYKQTFQNFTGNMYDYVYNNSSKIIWEINDFKWYHQLCQDKEFARKIQPISLWATNTNFKAIFYFKQGFIIDNIESSIKLVNSL